MIFTKIIMNIKDITNWRIKFFIQKKRLKTDEPSSKPKTMARIKAAITIALSSCQFVFSLAIFVFSVSLLFH